LHPQTLHVKSSAQIHAEDVFQLLNSRHQQFTIDGPVDILKRSAVKEAEKPESERKERTITVL